MLNKMIDNLSELNSELRHMLCKSRRLREPACEKANAYGEQTLVIDILAEKVIINHFNKMDFVNSIYSEESGIIKLHDGEYSILIDPLDGTQNFIMGIPYYSVTIAVIDASYEVVASYVANLVSGDCFSAIKGEGAKFNGVKFYTKPQKDLANTHVIYVGLATNEVELKCLGDITKHVKSFRATGCGSLDLCCLALGNCGLFIDLSYSAKLVDVLASSLIIEEAGATVTDLLGLPITGIPKRCGHLATAVYESKFQVIGATGLEFYDFAFEKCNKMKMHYLNN